ncbi:hypothetical protein AHAS_Ahas13G0117300 [Arachis hypogaea]
MENLEALWVRMLSHKYYNGGRLNNNANYKSTDPSLWKELKKIWPVFQEHSVHYVSNDLSTYFWRDQWVKREGILIEKDINLVNVDLDNFVWEWTSTNGEWDLEKLRLHLPQDSIKKICHMSPPKEENEDDKVCWKLSIDGNFAVNTTYKSLSNWPKKIEVNFRQQMGNNRNFEWRNIFILTIWRLWYWRNREIHEQNYKRPPKPTNRNHQASD